jgi:hypothetical protein
VRHVAEGAIEHGNIMLDAKPDVCVLVEGAFPRRAYIGRFQRNSLVAVGLRQLHAAIPHPVPHVATPEENQARLQLLFLGNKRHVASLLFIPFCAVSVQILRASH